MIASSHMLVSKIKPCMSQYKHLHGSIQKLAEMLLLRESNFELVEVIDLFCHPQTNIPLAMVAKLQPVVFEETPSVNSAEKLIFGHNTNEWTAATCIHEGIIRPSAVDPNDYKSNVGRCLATSSEIRGFGTSATQHHSSRRGHFSTCCQFILWHCTFGKGEEMGFEKSSQPSHTCCSSTSPAFMNNYFGAILYPCSFPILFGFTLLHDLCSYWVSLAWNIRRIFRHRQKQDDRTVVLNLSCCNCQN